MNIVRVCLLPAFKALVCIVSASAITACAQATQTAAADAPQKPAAEAPAPTNQSAAKPRMATAPDGTRIAYEVAGEGPPLILVHGGGQTRRTWNQLGYVDRLSKRFKVITLDTRGTGDSDKPTTPGAYALDKVTADILAVADAAGAERFQLWGFGHGATIARHLAASSERVSSAVLVGMTMGPAVTGVLKDAIAAMQAKWGPLIQANAAGTLDLEKLSAGDRAAWQGGVAVNTLSLSALLEYPAVEPADLKAPTLWLVGADDSAAENAKSYQDKLTGTNVTLKVLGSVSYSDSFTKVEQMLEEIEPFLTKSTTTR